MWTFSQTQIMAVSLSFCDMRKQARSRPNRLSLPSLMWSWPKRVIGDCELSHFLSRDVPRLQPASHHFALPPWVFSFPSHIFFFSVTTNFSPIFPSSSWIRLIQFQNPRLPPRLSGHGQNETAKGFLFRSDTRPAYLEMS